MVPLARLRAENHYQNPALSWLYGSACAAMGGKPLPNPGAFLAVRFRLRGYGQKTLYLKSSIGISQGKKLLTIRQKKLLTKLRKKLLTILRKKLLTKLWKKLLTKLWKKLLDIYKRLRAKPNALLRRRFRNGGRDGKCLGASTKL